MNSWRVVHMEDRGLLRGPLVLCAAVALALVVSGLLLALQGMSPLQGLKVLFSSIIGSKGARDDLGNDCSF
ncbi:MAG: hypothetical protein ACLFMP_07260, partial [Desulfonatronovibrionaceae bacterium]